MSSTTGFTKSFSLELLLGVHNFAADSIKIALFGAAAAIDVDTAAYSAVNEIVGTGYDAGGKAMAVAATYPKLDPRGAVRFDPVVWNAPSTFQYSKALIYNASKGNKSIFVIDYGSLRGPADGPHTISTPLSAPPLILIGGG